MGSADSCPGDGEDPLPVVLFGLLSLTLADDRRYDLMREAFDLLRFVRAERDQVDRVESQIREAGQSFRELVSRSGHHEVGSGVSVYAHVNVVNAGDISGFPTGFYRSIGDAVTHVWNRRRQREFIRRYPAVGQSSGQLQRAFSVRSQPDRDLPLWLWFDSRALRAVPVACECELLLRPEAMGDTNG